MTPLTTQYGGIGGMGYMMDDYEIGIAYEYENFPVLLPYHTLLLLEDPEEILKDIPLDANPTLVKLVQILVPYQWYDVGLFLSFRTMTLYCYCYLEHTLIVECSTFLLLSLAHPLLRCIALTNFNISWTVRWLRFTALPRI